MGHLVEGPQRDLLRAERELRPRPVRIPPEEDERARDQDRGGEALRSVSSRHLERDGAAEAGPTAKDGWDRWRSDQDGKGRCLMRFKDFIRSVRVTTTTRGAFVADIKTLINADVFPPVEVWADLYRFLSRRGSSSETIDIARKVWREYKTK